MVHYPNRLLYKGLSTRDELVGPRPGEPELRGLRDLAPCEDGTLTASVVTRSYDKNGKLEGEAGPDIYTAGHQVDVKAGTVRVDRLDEIQGRAAATGPEATDLLLAHVREFEGKTGRGGPTGLARCTVCRGGVRLRFRRNAAPPDVRFRKATSCTATVRPTRSMEGPGPDCRACGRRLLARSPHTSGTVPVVCEVLDGVACGYGLRRAMLDKILVDAGADLAAPLTTGADGRHSVSDPPRSGRASSGARLIRV